MARLIVVSNRVAVPSGTNGNQAGGLAVAVVTPPTVLETWESSNHTVFPGGDERTPQFRARTPTR